VVALAYAQERGATEAVFANLAGHPCEGTGSNVFYVVGGELRTPTLAAGCLAGISRALLLEWYGGREVDEPVEVLADAEEIFLVSTTRDVQAVTRCDGRELVGLYEAAYANEPFVALSSTPPATKRTTGSNVVQVHVSFDERTGRILAIGVEDNLVKGAAGQAIQAFNIVHGLPETAGLEQLPLAP